MKFNKRKWMAVIICLAVASACIGIRNRSSVANEMKDKPETKTESVTGEKKVIVVDPGHGGTLQRKSVKIHLSQGLPEKKSFAILQSLCTK